MKLIIYSDYIPPDKIGGVGEIAIQCSLTMVNDYQSVEIISTGVRKPSLPASIKVTLIGESPRKGILRGSLRLLADLRKDDVKIVLHQSSMVLFLPYARLLNRMSLRGRRTKYPALQSLTTIYQTSFIHEFQYLKPYTVDGAKQHPTARELLERWTEIPVHILLDTFAWIGASNVGVVSFDHKQHFEMVYQRICQRTINVTPNGVATRFFNNSSNECTPRQETLQATAEPEGSRINRPTRFGYIGVLRHRKRLPLLLKAFQRIREDGTEVELHIYGPNRHLKDLFRLNQGLAQNVYLHGKIDPADVPAALRNIDVACIPSPYEGLPLAMLEALACGIPCVGVRRWGGRDVLEDQFPRLLFDADDLDSLVDAMKYGQELSMGFNADKFKQIAEDYKWSSRAIEMCRIN